MTRISANILKIIGLIVIILPVSFIVFGLLYPGKFIENGAWGDFLGGTLNPILTAITFLAVLATLHYQREELYLTRKELEASTRELERSAEALNEQIIASRSQTFESSFFHMLAHKNEIVKAVKIEIFQRGELKRTHEGFVAFTYLADQLIRRIDANSEDSGTSKQHILSGFEDFYSNNYKYINQYFSWVYRIFCVVEYGGDNKKQYIDVLWDSISGQELSILLCYTRSEKDLYFTKMMVKHGIVDVMKRRDIFGASIYQESFASLAVEFASEI